MNTSRALMTTATLIFAGTASAQVVTPPPGPSEPLPPYYPPAPPEPELETYDTPDGLDPNLYSDVEFESIVKRDGEGRLVVLDRPDLAAINAAPVIPDELRPLIDATVKARNERLMRGLAANPRATINVVQGVVETLDMSDPLSIQRVVESTQAISPKEPVVTELVRIGIVDSPTQQLINRIYNEYQSAHFAEINADYAAGKTRGQPDANSATAAFLLAEGMRECHLLYNTLALEIAADAPGVFADAGADAPDINLSGGTEQERIDRVTEILAELDDNTIGSVLSAAISRVIAKG